MSDLEYDLSRSLKVKCDSVIELPIYAFLLMFISNIWPNSAPLQDIRLQNLSDLEFDLSRSLKVKCDQCAKLAPARRPAAGKIVVGLETFNMSLPDTPVHFPA